jgi:hypothetical protein
VTVPIICAALTPTDAQAPRAAASAGADPTGVIAGSGGRADRSSSPLGLVGAVLGAGLLGIGLAGLQLRRMRRIR